MLNPVLFFTVSFSLYRFVKIYILITYPAEKQVPGPCTLILTLQGYRNTRSNSTFSSILVYLTPDSTRIQDYKIQPYLHQYPDIPDSRLYKGTGILDPTLPTLVSWYTWLQTRQVYRNPRSNHISLESWYTWLLTLQGYRNSRSNPTYSSILIYLTPYPTWVKES